MLILLLTGAGAGVEDCLAVVAMLMCVEGLLAVVGVEGDDEVGAVAVDVFATLGIGRMGS